MSQSVREGSPEGKDEAARRKWLLDVLGLDPAVAKKAPRAGDGGEGVAPPSLATVQGWKQQFDGEQTDLKAAAAEIRKALNAFRDPRDADPDDLDAIATVRASIRDAVAGPVLQPQNIDAAYDHLLDLHKTIAGTSQPAKQAQAREIRNGLAAFRDPEGATAGEAAELALARQAVTDAVAGEELTSRDIAAGYDALGDLSAAVDRVSRAAAARQQQQGERDAAREALAEAAHDHLNRLAAEAAGILSAATAKANDGIATWRAALADDNQQIDPDRENAARAALAAVGTAVATWRKTIAALRDDVVEDPASVSEADITDAAEAALIEVAAQQHLLQEQLADLAKIAKATTDAKNARLESSQEVQLTNTFSGWRQQGKNASLKVDDRRADGILKSSILGGDLKSPDPKYYTAIAFLVDMAREGGDAAASVKASKQKPAEVIKNYVAKTDNSLLPIVSADLPDFANELLSKGLDAVVAMLRQLQAIGGNRDEKRWLAKLFIHGTPAAVLPRFYAARATLAGVSLGGEYAKRLDAKMADPGFNPVVFDNLDAVKVSNSLFLAGVKAFLLTGDETLATKVATDFYGLVADARPGNATEGRLASGMSDGVVSASKIRTIKSTTLGSGHAYKFAYLQGAVQGRHELHVHEQKPNWHPAWKLVANPYEKVEGRADYNINPALKSALAKVT